MGKRIGTLMYDEDTAEWSYQVGLPGTPEVLGDDIVESEAIGSTNAVVGDQGVIVTLTNSTGVVGDDTIENVPAASAAVTDTTAASLTSTNAAITALENNVADLAEKIIEILDALEDAGLTTAPEA